MTEPTFHSHAVPKPLWDELENVFLAKSRTLIEDIAATLSQDKKILWNAFKNKKAKVYLIELNDPTDEIFLCEALSMNSAVAHRCRKPVLYGERVCPEHLYWSFPSSLTSKPILRRIKCDGVNYFVDSLTHQIYDSEYKRVGYLENEKGVLFEIEDSS